MSHARVARLLVLVPLLGLVVSLSPRRASAETERDRCIEECLARCDAEDERQNKGCLHGSLVEDSCHPDCEYHDC